MSTKDNVTAAGPKITGAVFVAPAGTAVPTDATTALGAAFKELGYVSDAGVSNDTTPSVATVKAWGGDPVLELSEEQADTYKTTLIEILNLEVLKLVYGSENVSGTLATGISINVKNRPVLEENVIVIDMILRNGALMRHVLPAAVVTAVGTKNYVHNGAVGFETTLTCHNDSSGNSHYEYISGATGATGATNG